MSNTSVNNGVLQRALTREKAARRAAEDLLESKSSELYESNRELTESRQALEQKVAERTADLRDARDEAIRLMEERTVFLARISHELRTPLNAILGIIQLMLQDESRENERRKLETVNESSQVLLTMINEILDFTKIEAGETSIEFVPTDVAAIVHKAVDMLTQTAASKGVSLFTQMRAGMSERVVTDPSRLTQIVINLLSNAVKFTSEGSVTVQLDVLEHPHAELVLSITDTGVGVHPDRLENIFLPFKQSMEGQQIHAGGTGLGLAIVQRSAQLLGGKVSAESTLGEGSTFTARLPIEPAKTIEQTQAEASKLTGELAHNRVNERTPDTTSTLELGRYQNIGQSASLRILAADDNEMNRSVMEMQLDYLGLQADYVSNGEEVVRAVLEHQYDVVLMDISMPLMNGEDACRAIRDMPSIHQPKIVAVTASAMSGDRERYLAGGMNYYLPKPVDSLALAKLMEEILKDLDSAKGKKSAAAIAPNNQEKTPETQLIDLQDLKQRLGEMLEPMLRRVGPIFVAELPPRILRLNAAWDSNDQEDLTSILHALKGSAASAGALKMAALCGQGEERIRSGKTLSQAAIDEISECCNASAIELQNLVKSL